jgi:ABC-type phosphate/phosphonate transport system substrate-binding protein
MHLEVEKGTTAKDLLAFGKKLNAGTYHFGVLWGVEYGWLKKKYPNLEVLAVITPTNSMVKVRSQLRVRKQKADADLKNLKGLRLARYKGAPLMDQAALEKMLREKELDPKGFFHELDKPFATIKDAVQAVRAGKADCVMINAVAYNRLKTDLKNLDEDLVGVEESSKPFPLSVVIGSRKTMKSTVWTKVQDELLAIDKKPEGKTAVSFWRVDSFAKPEQRFLSEIDKAARDFPINWKK